MMGAAGAGGAGEYVDDLFSTYLYDATGMYGGGGSGQTINNGIDLAGEGGMVWITNRPSDNLHSSRNPIFDTERGAGKFVYSDEPQSEKNDLTELSSFNSNGFSLGDATGGYGATNDKGNATRQANNGDHYVSWTFRKCPGFFDVVTYTGNGTSGRTIAHNLGSVPGSIWIKAYSHNNTNWAVYHKETGNTKILVLDEADATATSTAYWNDTSPTSSVFTVGNQSRVNANGETYVAYIFGSDEQSFGDSGDETIIKCGSYTGTGSAGLSVDLGFEPQWLLVKSATRAGQNWTLVDAMRGFTVGAVDSRFQPNNVQFANTNNVLEPTSTGFRTGSSVIDEVNDNGQTFIYIAIRRPHKPPEAGTEVFAVDNNDTGNSTNRPSLISNFPVDVLIRRNQIVNSDSPEFGTRLINRIQNVTTINSSNDAGTSTFPYNNGTYNLGYVRATDHVWMFKRAPKFLDVIAYEGTGSTLNLTHNLTVTPELIIAKRYDGNSDWSVVHNYNLDKNLRINNSNAVFDLGFKSFGTPSATTFSPHPSSGSNSSGENYIVFLFATRPGVSKVGTYTGTTNDIDVDCGFTAGARFILIKRADIAGDWYLYDSERGIVGGNDPYYLLNSNSAHVTSTDYIDPLNAGFSITDNAPAALNASGGTYIFLAIA